MNRSELLSGGFIGTCTSIGQDPSLFAELSFFLNVFLTRPELSDVFGSCSQLAEQGSSIIVSLYCRQVPGLNIKENLIMF